MKTTSRLLTPLLPLLLFVAAVDISAQDTWFRQSPLPTGESLNSVHFTDANTGWAVGLNGAILATVGSLPIIPKKSSLPLLVMEKNRILRFALPHRVHVSARLFDLRGRRTALVLDEVREAGINSVTMPRVTGGFYLLDFRAGEFHRTLMMAQ